MLHVSKIISAISQHRFELHCRITQGAKIKPRSFSPSAPCQLSFHFNKFKFINKACYLLWQRSFIHIAYSHYSIWKPQDRSRIKSEKRCSCVPSTVVIALIISVSYSRSTCISSALFTCLPFIVRKLQLLRSKAAVT